jgi:hypothetical protein
MQEEFNCLSRKISFVGLWDCGIKVPTLAKIRYFTPNPFSRNQNWTFINVQFWKSQNTFGKSNI